jgi:hypothetical protein
MTPANFVPVQPIPDPNPADGSVENQDLLIGATEIFSGIWEDAEFSSKLDVISEPTLVHVQQRSFTRMWYSFRRLQIITVAQELPQGLLLRTRRIVAEIHTESSILRKTTLILGQKYPFTQALARMGRIIPVAGSLCSVLSLADDGSALVPVYAQFFQEVKNRCDNNNDTALDLAVALSSVLDVAFPAPVNSALLWPIWWNILSDFEGWSTSCN